MSNGSVSYTHLQGKDMDSIMQSLESGVEELFTSNRYQEFLKTMAKMCIRDSLMYGVVTLRPDLTVQDSYLMSLTTVVMAGTMDD